MEVPIHVERAIGRIKNYRILQGILLITPAASASQIFTVCVHLPNSCPPVVQLFKFIDIHDIIILYYIIIVMRVACTSIHYVILDDICNGNLWHNFRHYMPCVPVNKIFVHSCTNSNSERSASSCCTAEIRADGSARVLSSMTANSPISHHDRRYLTNSALVVSPTLTCNSLQSFEIHDFKGEKEALGSSSFFLSVDSS